MTTSQNEHHVNLANHRLQTLEVQSQQF